MNVSEFTSNYGFLQIHSNKNNYEEEIDLMLYENNYCLIANSYDFCKRNKKFTHLCRRFLSAYGSQTQLGNYMSRCIEQEICKISNMNRNKKIEFNHWYMKKDPRIWIDADFECMNIPVHGG